MEKKRSCEFRKKRSFSQERFFLTRGYPCASFGAWGADECSEIWQSSEGHCLSRNVPNTASPLWGGGGGEGNMFSIWCSTCIVRTRALGVRHWRLQATGKAPRASMLNTKVSIEWHQQVENWTLFQMQRSFFDVTLKVTVLQRHFHKFCDTPSI